MSSCITLKEAKKKLTYAAYEFAPVIKEFLEVWLQAADGLPNHLQTNSTAPATELVQVALQQAPWPMQQHEPRQLAWLQKHVPGISAAMQDSFREQLGTSTRRLRIVQSLLSKPDDVQVSEAIYAERSAHVLLGIMAWGVYLVAPAAVLCIELAPSYQGVSTRMQQGHDAQHRLKQGSNLITRVGAGLKDRKTMLVQLASEYNNVFDGLKGPLNSHEHANSLLACERCKRHVSVICLELLAQLPPGHVGTAHFYHFVCDCGYLQKEDLEEGMLARAQQALCRVLAQPTLLSNLRAILPPGAGHEVQQLVCRLQVTVEQLQAAGVSAAEAQQLLSKAASDIKPSGSDSTADSSSGQRVDSGQAAEAGAGSGGPDWDDSGVDMQALLQLMYGCTVHHNSATA